MLALIEPANPAVAAVFSWNFSSKSRLARALLWCHLDTNPLTPPVTDVSGTFLAIPTQRRTGAPGHGDIALLRHAIGGPIRIPAASIVRKFGTVKRRRI